MLSVAAALLLGPRLARRLKTSWAVAGLFVGSAGTILAATLTPLAGQPEVAAGSVRSCDFARMAPPPLEALLQVDDVSLNVLLFVPLGIAVGLLPVARRTIPTAGLAVVLPFAIEATQQLAPVLGRGCESADVVDNLTGLLGGGVIGVVLRAMRDIAGPPPAAEGRADGS